MPKPRDPNIPWELSYSQHPPGGGGAVSTLLHSTIRFLALFAESLTNGLLVVDVRAESVLPSAPSVVSHSTTALPSTLFGSAITSSG